MRFSAQVHVTLKPTVNDPQGNAVLGSLHMLGFGSVSAVRVGKYLTLTLEANDEQEAGRQVDAMGERFASWSSTKERMSMLEEPTTAASSSMTRMCFFIMGPSRTSRGGIRMGCLPRRITKRAR